MTTATTIVYPFDLGTPTGLHVLVRQILEALIADGERVTLVLAKAASFFDEEAVESYRGLGSELEIRWLPPDTFAPAGRHRLSFALERLAEGTDRWLCFGVEGSAFVGSLVARRVGTPCTSFIAARDILGRSMLHPEEIGATMGRSRLLLCANPALLALLEAFAAPELTLLRDERRIAIALPACAAEREAELERGDYVCTTGALGLFEDLAELTSRVVSEIRETGAKRWLHLGTVHPQIVGRLASALALRGLGGRFDATGLRGASEHEQLVRRSLALLKPRGELDTGLSIREARRWGIRVSLPVGGSPFSADGHAAAPHGLDEIDATEISRRLLDR